jgi:predicted HicB family RNase H-like nuclease
MKTPKIGRPVLPKAKYRGILMQARVSPEEHKAIIGAINRSQDAKSTWIRKALLYAAMSDKPLP